MTTFTTEDRIIAEQNGSVTINVEPIPFAGLVTLTEPKYRELTDEEIDALIMDVAEKPTDEDLYDFARAILRKAQEK
jgi:hypothetical protein